MMLKKGVVEMDQKTKERDSQFELLRIVAMFFVVTGHLIVKGADTVGLLSPPYRIEKKWSYRRNNLFERRGG